MPQHTEDGMRHAENVAYRRKEINERRKARAAADAALAERLSALAEASPSVSS